MWKQFRPWLALDSVQRELFNRQWEITDKIFKVAEWTIVVGIFGGMAASLFDRKEMWPGWLVALLTAGLGGRLVIWTLLAWVAGWWDSRFPRGKKRPFAYIALFFLILVLVGPVAFAVGRAILEVQIAAFRHT